MGEGDKGLSEHFLLIEVTKLGLPQPNLPPIPPLPKFGHLLTK